MLAASVRIRLTAASHAVDFSQALSTELLMMRPEAFAKTGSPGTKRDPGCAMLCLSDLAAKHAAGLRWLLSRLPLFRRLRRGHHRSPVHSRMPHADFEMAEAAQAQAVPDWVGVAALSSTPTMLVPTATKNPSHRQKWPR